MFGVGNVIGVVSSLVGIGGGTLSVPFMIWCNMAVHHAIGSSAAIGFPIAIAGTIGYVINGLNAVDLPSLSIGYVYLPALAGIVVTSMLTAPLGGASGAQPACGAPQTGFCGFVAGDGDPDVDRNPIDKHLLVSRGPGDVCL